MKEKRKYLLFWVFYTLFIFMIFNILTELQQALLRTLGMVSMQMLTFNINFKYLLPNFYKKKKFNYYIISNILLLLLSVFIIDFLIRYSFYLNHLERNHSYTIDTIFNFKDFDISNLEIIFNHMMPILLAIFIAFIFYNFSEQKKQEQKQILLVKAEKDFLVSQISPHFLFNVFNNIYSLTLSNDSKGSEAVMQLSKMLNYSLYTSSKETVSLREEIEYITNFIALFKLKDDEINGVAFNYSNANSEFRISPMLLIPFVENAFKHGNIEDIHNGNISIILHTEKDMFSFECENSYQVKKSIDESCGIGITNVKRRLKLLYPNKHKLEIKKSEYNYKVNLSITI